MATAQQVAKAIGRRERSIANMMAILEDCGVLVRVGVLLGSPGRPRNVYKYNYGCGDPMIRVTPRVVRVARLPSVPRPVVSKPIKAQPEAIDTYWHNGRVSESAILRAGEAAIEPASKN